MGPMRAHSIFTAKWVTALHSVLDRKLADLQSNKYTVAWGDLSGNIVKPIIKKLLKESTYFTYFIVNGDHTFGQLVTSGFNPEMNYSAVKHPFKFQETELLMYHHSVLKKELKKSQDVKKIMQSELLIAALFSYSLEQCRNVTEANKNKTDAERHQLVEPREVTIGPPRQLVNDENFLRWVVQFLKEKRLSSVSSNII